MLMKGFRTSLLELIFSTRLDGKKDIQSVKSARSVSDAELKARAPFIEE